MRSKTNVLLFIAIALIACLPLIACGKKSSSLRGLEPGMQIPNGFIVISVEKFPNYAACKERADKAVAGRSDIQASKPVEHPGLTYALFSKLNSGGEIVGMCESVDNTDALYVNVGKGAGALPPVLKVNGSLELKPGNLLPGGFTILEVASFPTYEACKQNAQVAIAKRSDIESVKPIEQPGLYTAKALLNPGGELLVVCQFLNDGKTDYKLIGKGPGAVPPGLSSAP